nr:MAG TPA: Rho termination factor, N-terminal domain [Caudoviricetes sp.]
MLQVRVKGPAIKLAGVWNFKGEEATITQEEYKANEQYLDLLSGEVEEKEDRKPQATASNNNEDEKELATLREKAKDLGIKGAHNMKKENLIAKIEEVEKAAETGSEDDGEDGAGAGEEGQPQE